VRDTINAARGVAWRQVHNFFTNPSFLLPSLLFPLFFFTAFVGGLSRIRDVPGFDFPLGYTAFQFVFVLLQSAAFSGVFTGFGIARDFETGFMRRLMLAAPNRIGIVIGYAIAGLVRWITVIVVVTGVAFAAQMKIGGDGVDLFALYTLGFFLSIVGTLWSTGVAMRLRTQQAFPVIQMPVFILLFFAPVYVPLSLLQGWLHGVARVNPITPLLEEGRGLISGSPDKTLLAFAILFALLAFFAVWAVRGLWRAEAAGS
jgi:ABC-type multidrug transport system permease subunit